jgi:hypothetical protein
VGSDLLLHLDLLLAALLLVQLRAQTAVVLGALRAGVALSGLSLASTLIMIKTLAMLLGKAFHVFILRHGGEWLWMGGFEGKESRSGKIKNPIDDGLCGEATLDFLEKVRPWHWLPQGRRSSSCAGANIHNHNHVPLASS